MQRKGPTGITSETKERLIRQALDARAHRNEHAEPRLDHLQREPADAEQVPERYYRFDLHPGYQQLRVINDTAEKLGVGNPYFKVHEGVAGVMTRIGGRDLVNFASYNYLGLCGDPRVSQAAKDAIDRFGTSVSASRLVAGERSVHRELERAIAGIYGVEDAVVFVSGHATNVTVIGHLFGPRDLILHDALIHNSVLQGIRLSGAHRLPYPHGDWDAAGAILAEQRRRYERVLIVTEGLFSMDGDYPDLPRLVELKQRYRALLMVDEAHALGVMGRTGLGIAEHFGLPGSSVDIWMGTLSKTLASCGGFIAGSTPLVEHLKFLSSGFLYSVGMAPPVAAAALAALTCMRSEPERVSALQRRGQLFTNSARAAGINVGSCAGLAIVPALVGSSARTVRLSHSLHERGIHVQPILYPAVPEKSARLRFFINCEHTEDQILDAVQALEEESARI